MVRTLSSSDTAFQKYVFPVSWFCLAGGVNVLMWSGRLFDPRGGPPSPEADIALLAIWLAPPLLAATLTRLLKRVRMSDHGLLISDYRREIFVPFSAIASVSQPKFEPSETVEIKFRAPTAFGDRITFVPRARFAFWRRDPALGELEGRVTKP